MMREAVGIAGFITLCVGCYLYSPPLAFVVGGGLALAAAIYGVLTDESS